MGYLLPSLAKVFILSSVLLFSFGSTDAGAIGLCESVIAGATDIKRASDLFKPLFAATTGDEKSEILNRFAKKGLSNPDRPSEVEFMIAMGRNTLNDHEVQKADIYVIELMTRKGVGPIRSLIDQMGIDPKELPAQLDVLTRSLIRFGAANAIVQGLAALVFLSPFTSAANGEPESVATFLAQFLYVASTLLSNAWAYGSMVQDAASNVEIDKIEQFEPILNGTGHLQLDDAIFLKRRFGVDRIYILLSEEGGEPVLDVVRWAYREHSEP